MRGLPSSREFTRRLEGLAQVAGLAATAWVVWFNVILSGHLAARIALASWIASCALAWSAAIVLVLRFMVRDLNGADWLPPTFRAAAAGVWFAPAVLLMLNFSPVGMVSALVLVMGATRLLLETPPPPHPGPSHFAASLAVSSCVQAAFAALLMRRTVPAAALLTLGAAMLITLSVATGAWAGHRAQNLPRSIMGLCLTVLLALMMGRVLGPGGFGGDGSGTAQAAPAGPAGNRLPAPSAAAARDHAPGRPLPNQEYQVPGSFPGVILWPELQPIPTLIAPLPISQGSNPALSRRFVIPFGGEYWMFRRPFDRPPFNSFFERGTPAWLSFSTSDGWPLEMEAHQRLEDSIQLGCCTSIDLDILNADHSAPHISLELLLIDHHPPVPPPLSLGTRKLASVPGVNAGRTVPAAETLSFRVPSDRRSARFDEFRVVYHRAIGLQNHSARIALQRFVLTP